MVVSSPGYVTQRMGNDHRRSGDLAWLDLGVRRRSRLIRSQPTCSVTDFEDASYRPGTLLRPRLSPSRPAPTSTMAASTKRLVPRRWRSTLRTPPPSECLSFAPTKGYRHIGHARRHGSLRGRGLKLGRPFVSGADPAFEKLHVNGRIDVSVPTQVRSRPAPLRSPAQSCTGCLLT